MGQLLLSIYRTSRRVLERYGIRKIYLRRIVPLGAYLKSRPIEVHGHKMLIDSTDALGIFRTGFYEPAETRLVKREIKQGDVVLDIGAHIGYYTLIFARLVGEEGRVIAFEPEPANFALLKRNIAMNGYQNVTLVQKAISDTTGRTGLYLNEWNTMHAIDAPSAACASVEVETVRLDDYFEGYEGRIDFVKMDIEGAEAKAIQGMRSMVQRHGTIKMLAEFYPFGLSKFGVTAKDYLRLLRALGFRVYPINEQGPGDPAGIDGFLASYDPESEWAHTSLFCISGG